MVMVIEEYEYIYIYKHGEVFFSVVFSAYKICVFAAAK